MKIELTITNDFIADNVLDGIARNCDFWLNKVIKDKIDDLEASIQKQLELAPNEINEQQLEKLVQNLEWQRANHDEWMDLYNTILGMKPKKAKTADVLKRAKAALK